MTEDMHEERLRAVEVLGDSFVSSYFSHIWDKRIVDVDKVTFLETFTK